MTKQNNQVADAGAANLDPVALKNDILEANKAFASSIMDQVNSALNGFKAAIPAPAPATSVRTKAVVDEEYDEDLADVQEELDALDLDENQSKAFLKVINKLTTKKGGKIKSEVLSTVDQTMSFKDQKAAIENEITTAFPTILDKTSALFKQSKVEFEKLSPEAKSSPEATALAIKSAALHLGIRPVSLAEARALAAGNDTGAGPGGEDKPNKERDAQAVTFAQSFGVDPEKFKAKMKEVRAKQNAR